MLALYPNGEDDNKRNQIYFYFKKFRYDHKLKKKSATPQEPLVSTIKKINSLPNNLASVELLFDYQDVGKHSFLPKLLPGLIQPCVDFPSFKWINVVNITYDIKNINKVDFKRVLVKIPQCMEDRSNEDLEKYVNKFVKLANKELYIGLPYQLEAFPTIFEDERFAYHINGDVYTNNYVIYKEP